MKYLLLLSAFLIASCAMKGETIYSQGKILGWENSGFLNSNGKLEVFFEVNNAEPLEKKMVIAGVTIEDELKRRNLGDTNTLKIKLNARAFEERLSVGWSATLFYGGRRLKESKVSEGTDSAKFGRVERKVDSGDRDGFKEIIVTNDSSRYDWVLYEFQISPPPPSDSFELEISIKDENSVSVEKVVFKPKFVESYHSN